jgi:hypothetical protein
MWNIEGMMTGRGKPSNVRENLLPSFSLRLPGIEPRPSPPATMIRSKSYLEEIGWEGMNWTLQAQHKFHGRRFHEPELQNKEMFDQLNNNYLTS